MPPRNRQASNGQLNPWLVTTVEKPGYATIALYRDMDGGQAA